MRVPRTFIFVDLSDFTDFTTGHGDEEAGRVLSGFRNAVRAVTSERGVRVAKWLGDGAMIVSVDERAAIAAALDLLRCSAQACNPLALRIGIATGHALLFEGDDYIGQAVNLAARLCDAAGPLQVLMPSDQAGNLPTGVVAEPAGTLVLKGFAEPIDVVSLSGQSPSTANDTGEIWTRSPFVA